MKISAHGISKSCVNVLYTVYLLYFSHVLLVFKKVTLLVFCLSNVNVCIVMSRVSHMCMRIMTIQNGMELFIIILSL